MPIKILPARLANQIAAGEVVERPASVLKELLENSIDAGATQIEIDIEKGGHKKIKITDNGSGIVKDELTLALSRHATSKVTDLEDLESICTLGFRGEALASISSVSRLTLTSKTAEQTEAWQARSEGRDMQVVIEPAAHPIGTSVEVLDLFFNTPARRKFLRTEKTEFNHIEELFNRIALSRYDVGLRLKHNGKVLKNLPAISVDDDPLKRVKQLCGASTCDGMFEIDGHYEGFRLKGWLSGPGHYRAMNDVQYVFVNNRMMRDKLIFHAIRQSYEGLLPDDKFPFFILYLDVPHKEVDVNVHPAKHEVRFHQSRLVHDFIFSIINDGLGQAISGQNSNRNSGHNSSQSSSQSSNQDIHSDTASAPLNQAGNPSVENYSPVNRVSDNNAVNERQVNEQQVNEQQVNEQQLKEIAAGLASVRGKPQEHGYVAHESHQAQPQPDTEYIQPLQPLSQSPMQSQSGSRSGINNQPAFNGVGSASTNGYKPASSQQIATAAHNYSNLMTVADDNHAVESNAVGAAAATGFNAATDVFVLDEIGVMVRRESRFYLVKQSVLLLNEVNLALRNGISQPLLLPVAMTLKNSSDSKSSDSKSSDSNSSDSKSSDSKSPGIKELVNDNLLPMCAPFSLELQLTGNKLILKQVPAGTRNQNWQQIMAQLIEHLPLADDSCLVKALANNWQATHSTEKLWQDMTNQSQEQLIGEFAIEVPLKQWLKGI